MNSNKALVLFFTIITLIMVVMGDWFAITAINETENTFAGIGMLVLINGCAIIYGMELFEAFGIGSTKTVVTFSTKIFSK